MRRWRVKSKRLLRGGFLIGQLDEAANLNQNALHGAAPEVRRGHVDADVAVTLAMVSLPKRESRSQ